VSFAALIQVKCRAFRTGSKPSSLQHHSTTPAPKGLRLDELLRTPLLVPCSRLCLLPRPRSCRSASSFLSLRVPPERTFSAPLLLHQCITTPTPKRPRIRELYQLVIKSHRGIFITLLIVLGFCTSRRRTDNRSPFQLQHPTTASPESPELREIHHVSTKSLLKKFNTPLVLRCCRISQLLNERSCGYPSTTNASPREL
jgi:hypothetical protein